MILNPRKSEKGVAEIVECLYAAHAYSPAEMLRIAKSKRANPYPAKIEHYGRIHCGHNPFLYARLVSDLRVEPDGGIKWTEPHSPEI